MSFRERAIWVALIVNLGVLGLCVYAVVTEALSGQADWELFAGLPLFAWLVTAFSVALLEWVTRFLPGSDPKAPQDERDGMIEARATALAYRVLMGGAVLLACWLLNPALDSAVVGSIEQQSGSEIDVRSLSIIGLNLIYLAMLGAEMTRWITQLVLYRRLR